MRTALSLLLLAAAATPATASTKDKAPTCHPAGPPVDCITVSRIQDSVRPDDRTIYFRVGVGKWYRNDLPQSCPRLSSFATTISYKVTTNQLCSVDIIHVLESGFGEIGACGLGKFTPWERDKTH